MRLEKQSLLKAQRKKRRPSSCLPSCFLASPVSDSDVPEPPSPPRSAAQSRRKLLSPWFLLSGKRQKKAVAVVDAPPKAAAEESNMSSAKVKAQQHPPGLQQRNNVDSISLQSSLPHISPKYTARVRPAPPSKNSHPVQAQIERTIVSSSIISSSSSSSSSSADSIRTGKLGPIFGVGIMLATLAILLFADRVTAVVCLCFCLYILRLARASSSSPSPVNYYGAKMGSKVVDMDSNEYKKRVILEGLLERNGRKPSLPIAATA